VYAPTSEELRDIPRMRRLAIVLASLGYSRRQLFDEMIATFRDYEGRIEDADGRAFPLPDDLDTPFGDDPDFTCVSRILRWAQIEPKRPPQSRVLMRLRLLDLMVQIRWPHLHRHILR
jgi:hypothetical protein